jgi:hypothetical protein
MHISSPYYMFSNDQLGWLYRRHQTRQEISQADLARILRADPEVSSDPLMIHYMARVTLGELKRRPGRKSSTINPIFYPVLGDIIKERAAEISEERKQPGYKRLRGEKPPAEQAAEDVAAQSGFKFGSGRTLTNKISTARSGKGKFTKLTARLS